jgi:hypothetical protein
VAWTLKLAGNTPLQQRFTGREVSIPHLFEPTIP